MKHARHASVVAALCGALAVTLAAPPAPAAETAHAPSKKSPVVSLSSIDTLVTAAHVLTMDGADRVLSPGAVAIAGGRIIAVGTPSELLSLYSPKQKISRPRSVVLPGLCLLYTSDAADE